MLGREKTRWLRVAKGVEILSGLGPHVWGEPAAARNAICELLSVLPMTHLQLDLDRMRGWREPRGEWKDLLARAGDWAELLRETAVAVGDAVRGRAEWGIGLPNPVDVAESLGDSSERGVLKAGMQIASFLQGWRDAGLGFIALDLTGPSVAERVASPVLRNAQMYGWRRAAVVSSLSESACGAEIRLASGATIEDLGSRWASGELVGGGLGPMFWSGEDLTGGAPNRFLLYGEIPAGIEPAAIVEAGRRLERWMT